MLLFRKVILPLLILLLVMGACSTRTGPIAPSFPIGTATLTLSDAIAVTASPSLAETPIPSVTDTPVPPALPSVASPVLSRIDFQDEIHGWGIAVNKAGYILRTVDGGTTWLNATPQGIGPVGYSTNLVVLNTNTAWVLGPTADLFSGILYRTNDGGITWSSYPVPFDLAFLQFLNASTGRALTVRKAGLGSEAVELFQTSDGGAIWTSVFHDEPGQPGSSDSLPLAGIKNGMTFIDANTGWVTSTSSVDGEIFLYVTHDGGLSWSQQRLPLPAGYQGYHYQPQAPVFFGQDGFLPLKIYLPGSTALTLYGTHNGGLTWSGDPANANMVIQPGLLTLADPIHIWCWDGGRALSFSIDGAQTWKNVTPSLDLSGNLEQLQFVPASDGGFTGWALSRVNDAGQSLLYRTKDSVTWTLLIP